MVIADVARAAHLAGVMPPRTASRRIGAEARVDRHGSRPDSEEYAMDFWDAIGAIFWFVLLVAWFWLVISILTDLFSDRSLSGWAKGLWCLFVILLPWLGVLVYLIARGGSMHERALEHAQRNEQEFRQYVNEVAQPSSVADELAKLADLRDRGVISADDFESAKAKLLGQSSTGMMSPS
jgi:hypothetical protein